MKIKNKTKKKLIRLLSSLMIVFSLLNLVGIVAGMGNKVYAADAFTVTVDAALVGIFAMTGGIGLIIFILLKLVIIVVGMILQAIMSGAFSSLEGNLTWSGLKEIIFAGAGDGYSNFLDVNFFDFTVDGTLLAFREAVAKWYYILRLISAAILLVILIYVGIRMAISTIASEQAKYKQMLVDWVTSLALLFLLHYIIIFAITVNSSLVKALASGVKDPTEDMIGAMVGRALVSRNRRIFSCSFICFNDRTNIYVFRIIYETYGNSRIFNYDFTTYHNYLFD